MSALPDLLAHPDAALTLLRRRPACVFTDIDGTLAPIVADPAAAAVPPSTRDALQALAERIHVVALTGRSAADARRMLSLDALTYSGNHGAEWWEDGVASLEPSVAPYLARMREIAQAVQRAPLAPGVVVEEKGASLSVHYRSAPDPSSARTEALRLLRAHAEGMTIREGKMVAEVRAPTTLSKGEAVRSFIRRKGIVSAVVLGDDRTDAEAFAVVREMRDAGEVDGLCAAVATADAPDDLLSLADYTLADTDAVGRCIRLLASQVTVQN